MIGMGGYVDEAKFYRYMPITTLRIFFLNILPITQIALATIALFIL